MGGERWRQAWGAWEWPTMLTVSRVGRNGRSGWVHVCRSLEAALKAASSRLLLFLHTPVLQNVAVGLRKLQQTIDEAVAKNVEKQQQAVGQVDAAPDAPQASTGGEGSEPSGDWQ